MVIRVDYLGLIVPGLFLAILGVLNQIEGYKNLFNKEKESISSTYNLFFVLLFFESFVLYELQSPSLYQITSTLLFFLTISVSLRTYLF